MEKHFFFAIECPFNDLNTKIYVTVMKRDHIERWSRMSERVREKEKIFDTYSYWIFRVPK